MGENAHEILHHFLSHFLVAIPVIATSGSAPVQPRGAEPMTFF
jgi:hypothetical protein